MLSGSILEAVLYGFLKGQIGYLSVRRGASFSLKPDGSLQHYLEIFNRHFKDLFPPGFLPDIAADYRDLVHVNRELSYPPGICVGASVEMLRILDSVLETFAEFAG